MLLPDFNNEGELPQGVHQAEMSEVLARFGAGSPQRQAVTERLLRISALAKATGQLNRLVLFGSYVTTKPNPNDIDVILIFDDDFDMRTCDDVTRALLDHSR